MTLIKRPNCRQPDNRESRWGAYLIRRLLLVIPTLWAIITINFFIVQIAPGGPVDQAIAAIEFGNAGVLPGAGGEGVRASHAPNRASAISATVITVADAD